MAKSKFMRTGGGLVAEKNSSSNLYHVEQTSQNEGIVIFKSKDGKNVSQYRVTKTPGAPMLAVTKAFSGFNKDLSVPGSSAGKLYWKHFARNQHLSIKKIGGKK